MYSTPWAPEVVDFPRCNLADIEWYMRMQTDLPLVDPKVEMLFWQCEEEDATLEETMPMSDNWLPH